MADTPDPDGPPPELTAEGALRKAADILERADVEPNPGMVDSKVQIAEAWARLAEAIAEVRR